MPHGIWFVTETVLMKALSGWCAVSKEIVTFDRQRRKTSSDYRHCLHPVAYPRGYEGICTH